MSVEMFTGSPWTAWIGSFLCCGLLLLITFIGTGSWSSAGRDTSSNSKSPSVKYPIHILHDDSNATVDIVAVHGLGANPDYAWVWLPKNNPVGATGYPDKPFNWLEKLLPQELACRVMTFNYNSNWFLNAPQLRVSSISDCLLESLQILRKECSDRPLIFIGHSFGGNVIEQAIVTATQYGSNYMPISQSTVGVVFLGTPHEGCQVAKWGSFVALLASSVTVTERRILKNLEKDSESLENCMNQFYGWLFRESVRVLCCFETRRTAYLRRIPYLGNILPWRKLVVPEKDACIRGHRRISLDTDHLRINKFYGPEDPSFYFIYPYIVQKAKIKKEKLELRRNPNRNQENANVTSTVLRACLQKMNVKNPQDMLSKVQQKGRRVEHTCEWILKREDFSRWAAADTPQLLRLVGSPGIGKTVMSTYLVEVLKEKVEKSLNKTFAYFFCDDKDQDQKTPTYILRSLIWQMLLQKPELFDQMESDYQNGGDKLFGDVFALWRIFGAILRGDHAGEAFILIDALDECDRSARKEFFDGLQEVFQQSPSAQTGKFKFLVTYRPQIADIEAILGDFGISIMIEPSDVKEDLEEYIDSKIIELARRKRYPPALEKKVKYALKRQHGGTFLCISLMFEDLLGLHEGGLLLNQVLNNPKHLPHGLEDIYMSILGRIPKTRQDDVGFVLHCMVAARRPLTKIEIEAAFATWTKKTVLPREDLQDFKDICAACGPILYLGSASSEDDATLNFCHQSVKDFLLNLPSVVGRAWYHTVEAEANLLLFEVCWRHLSTKELKCGESVICRRFDRKERLGRLFYRWLDFRSPALKDPFLEYAFAEWEDHAIGSAPVIREKLEIDIQKTPTLRDAWLLRTAMEGQDQALELLILKYGANVNIEDEYGITPLSYAARNGHEAVVRLLLDNKADTQSMDSCNRTPLSHAAATGHEATAKLLLDYETDIELRQNCSREPLLSAAKEGHEAVVKLLLDYETDIESRDNILKRTPLSSAAAEGRKEVVKMLLDRKADIESRDRFDRTPLSCAAGKGHREVVKLLLDYKAAIESRDADGRTPLSCAAENGHEVVVKLLLDCKADIESRDTTGRTLVMCRDGGFDDIDYSYTPPVWGNDYGRTPLSWAAEKGHEAVVKLLLDHKADTENRDNQYGRTPLSWAAGNGHEAVVKLLLNYKADVNSRDKIYKRTPLLWAAEERHDAVVLLLKSYSCS